LRSSLVSKAQTSILAFTVEVAGAVGDGRAGEAIVTGLEDGALPAFAGGLLSVD
jgi:hypothetical protein